MILGSDREVIDRVVADHVASLHTSFPARVLAYDVDAQTLDVRPALLREVPSDEPGVPWGFDQLPDLLGVQVMWPRAGGFAITFPIAVGDSVLVVCAEQATNAWRKGGQVPSHPGVVDAHGLNGVVCIPGWFPDAQKLANVSNTDLVIGKTDQSSSIRLKPNGGIEIGPSPVDAVALDNKTRQAISWAVTNHTHSTPSGPSGPGQLGVGLAVPSTASSKVKASV